MFLTKEARTQMADNKDGPMELRDTAKRATVAYAGSDGGRQALIAKAVSLHRSKQDVLAGLDDASRRKLSAMAEQMMPDPSKKAPPRKKS